MMIESTPFRAAFNPTPYPGLTMSASTASTVDGRRDAAFLLSRTIALIFNPRSKHAAEANRPTPPVAPITATSFGLSAASEADIKIELGKAMHLAVALELPCTLFELYGNIGDKNASVSIMKNRIRRERTRVSISLGLCRPCRPVRSNFNAFDDDILSGFFSSASSAFDLFLSHQTISLFMS
jgi:hypothetical protein